MSPKCLHRLGVHDARLRRLQARTAVLLPLGSLLVIATGFKTPSEQRLAAAGPICSLSLVGACVMQLRRGAACRALLLPRRSLLVMAGEARLAWAHYIPSHKTDLLGGESVPRSRRVSFTFRQVPPQSAPATAARAALWRETTTRGRQSASTCRHDSPLVRSQQTPSAAWAQQFDPGLTSAFSEHGHVSTAGYSELCACARMGMLQVQLPGQP